MGALLAAFLAYFGVYAGVLLGSFSAEELPIGRYGLRVLQLILLVIISFLLIYEILANMRYWVALLLIGFLVVESSYLIRQKIHTFSLHPKERMLLTYALLAGMAVLLTTPLGFTYSALILLYGLITGSLIAEPFVEDRKLVPWFKPYVVAAKWTWTYPAVFIGLLILEIVAL